MLTHPENGVTLVDRFNVPVDVGDSVVIAKKARGSYHSNARSALFDGVIKKITPLVPHPRHGLHVHWYSTGLASRIPLVREDQLAKSHQTEYLCEETRDGSPPDWKHAWLAAVDVPGMDRLIIVPWGKNLIRVPTSVSR